jgi:CrcB protein
MKVVLVMLGGALGTLVRYSVVNSTFKFVVHNFPLGTLIVNLVGSFFIGLLWGFFDQDSPSNLRAFLFVGVLGGFTTFSAYSIETLNLFRDGNIRLAVVNILANNVLGIALAFCGLAAARLVK